MKFKIKLTFLALITILSLASSINAAEVLREITPESPRAGNVIEVKINILNDGYTQVSYEIEERIPNQVTLVEPSQPYEVKQQDGVKIPVLKWNILAEPGKVTSVSYKIKAEQPGQLAFSPVKIIDLSTYETLTGSSNELIVLCNPDKACSERENYLNCPEDCTTGAKDGICNPINDGICDVDCTKNADSDCKSQSSDITWLYYLIAGLILLAIIVFIILKFFKGRQEDQPTQQQSQQTQQQFQPQQSQQPQPGNQDPLAGFPGARTQ